MPASIKKETITPQKAADYLALNFSDNRKLRQTVVDQYADDMASGRWIDTGEPIRFDEYNNLIDGQFRLSAIVQSGVTVEMWVVRGLSEGAHLVIDTGLKRTPADALRIAGIVGYEANRASLAKRIIMYERGSEAVLSNGSEGRSGLGRKGRVSTSEIVAYVQNHPELLTLCEFSGRLYNSQISNILSPSDYGFAAWLLSQTSKAGAENFLTKLATQEDIPAGESPIRTLFRKLQGRMTSAEKLREIEAAFRAHLAGKDRYRLSSLVKPAPAVRQTSASI